MIPKFGGRDCELSSTGIDRDGNSINSADVTRAVLRHIAEAVELRGGRVWSSRGGFYASSTDCQRRWSSNGSCHYGDLGHTECCTPTCLDPYEFARRSVLSVRIAEEARQLAEAASQGEAQYMLSTANADTLDPSISFGTHISMAIEESLWADLFMAPRRPSRLPMVASGIAAAIPFFGAGYLLPTQEGIRYSLSARAHHITRVWTLTTTEAYRRGILNSRREAHGSGFERLHLIGFDYCLQSSALLFSFLQCLLAAAEESFCQFQLVDPVRALHAWSWGLNLETGQLPATAALVDGRHLTLPEYLRELTGTLLRMAESGFIDETVAPHAAELLPRIIQLTHDAGEGNVVACAKHLTWASKLLCLLGHCDEENQALGDASTRLLDHDFANTDRERGLFWKLWEQGDVDPLIDLDDVEAGWTEAPHDTRDYVRGRLIERFSDQITYLDWSFMEFRRSDNGWGPRVRIDLPQPGCLTRDEFEPLIAASRDVEELAERLAAFRAARDLEPTERMTPQLSSSANGFAGPGT